MSDEIQGIGAGSALTHEVRTYDPHGPKEISALAAAIRLDVKQGTMYGWLYTKKVVGERRGKAWFIPAAEMQRLLDLKERGVLEGTMRAGQGGGSQAAKAAGSKGGHAAAKIKHERKVKVAQPKKQDERAPASFVSLPKTFGGMEEKREVAAPEPEVDRQVTLTVNQLRGLVRDLMRVQEVVAPLKMTVYLMED